MAPGKPVGTIKIRVPRHNAHRIGVKLDAEVRSQAEAENIRVETYQPDQESLAQAVVCIQPLYIEIISDYFQESASDWNSLLMTARAERGPQWDIGTQL